MDWMELLNRLAITLGTTIITTLLGILFSKIFSKMNNSRIYKYAKTLVEAAEQKYPNEGTKMGPQKESYVMSQLSVKFPKIRDSQYLYNIVLQCVYELNNDMHKEDLVEDKNIEVESDLTISNENSDVVETIEPTVDNNVESKPQVQKKRPSSF